MDGYSGWANVYNAKTITMPANSKTNQFLWGVADNGGAKFDYTTNVSCGLPPGTGLTMTSVHYAEWIGS